MTNEVPLTALEVAKAGLEAIVNATKTGDPAWEIAELTLAEVSELEEDEIKALEATGSYDGYPVPWGPVDGKWHANDCLLRTISGVATCSCRSRQKRIEAYHEKLVRDEG